VICFGFRAQGLTAYDLFLMSAITKRLLTKAIDRFNIRTVEYESMKVISIGLPQKLSARLKERAGEAGTLPEELGIEFLLRGLDEKLDPEDLVEQYQDLSQKYLAEAKDLLAKGDLVQTSEKLWGATASTIKMVAAKRGVKLEKHGSLWAFINAIARESGDRDFIRIFGEANALHRNFYENEMPKESVDAIAQDIESLIIKLRKVS